MNPLSIWIGTGNIESISAGLQNRSSQAGVSCGYLTSPLNNQLKNSLWDNVKKAVAMENEEKRKAMLRSKRGVSSACKERGRWRDIVAKKTGFKSAASFLSARKVYLYGNLKIRSLVDMGFLNITQAEKIAELNGDTQLRIAKILEAMVNDGFSDKNISRVVKNLVKHVIPNKTLLHQVAALADNLNGSVNIYDLIAVEENKKLIKNNPLDGCHKCCSHSRGETGQNTDKAQNDDLSSQLISLTDSFAKIIITQSEIQTVDEKTVMAIDKSLSDIENIAKNYRKYIRLYSPHFKDSFDDIVKHYRRSLKECMGFFLNDFRRNIRKLDLDCVDEMQMTFHNSIAILHKVASSTIKRLMK